VLVYVCRQHPGTSQLELVARAAPVGGAVQTFHATQTQGSATVWRVWQEEIAHFVKKDFTSSLKVKGVQVSARSYLLSENKLPCLVVG